MTEAILSGPTVKPSHQRYSAPTPIRWGFGALSRFAPELARRVGVELFARPPRRQKTASQLAVLDTGTRFELRVRGHQLAAWSWGDGPTVLLQHGWGGNAGDLSEFVSPLLDAGYSVVAYDAPAHGESTGHKTALPELARTMTAVSHRLNGVHAVISHSLGAAATMLALRRGLRAKRAVLVSPPGDMNCYLDMFAQALGFSDDVQRRMSETFEREYNMRWSDFVAEEVARDQRTPALMFHDTDDVDVPFAHVMRLHATWDEAQLVRTRGLGHRRLLRDPAVVSQAVKFVALA